VRLVPQKRDIDRFLQHEIDIGSFPGAAYAVGSSRGIELENALGHAVAVPLRIPATLDTIWDCASITKPLITAALILRSGVSLDDSFDETTAEIAGAVIRMQFPLRQLVKHEQELTHEQERVAGRA